MRFSSRGTVSAGPVGALVMTPVLVAFWVVKVAVLGAVWVVASVLRMAVQPRPARPVRRPVAWPYIPPSGA